MPVYVDPDIRDEVIPKGKQQVESLFIDLKRLDKYLPVKKKNFYVQEVEQARELVK